MASSRKAVSKHPLLVYQRLGARLRFVPMVTAIACLLLLGLGWFGTQNVMPGLDASLLIRLWDQKGLLILAVVACVMLYVFSIIIGSSMVEARPKVLHVRAGIMSVNISYKRVKQIRLSQVSTQFSDDMLKGGDYGLLEPLLSTTCSVIDLYNWPSPGHAMLRRLWSKFMFSGDSVSLLLIVRDAMVLNQQIDGRLAEAQHRGKDKGYVDPIERATRMQNKQR
jgi:hypothetical protein